ncbi:hypothetical protein ACWFRJ_24395, partial [Streptomyces sp. NPDC055239]
SDTSAEVSEANAAPPSRASGRVSALFGGGRPVMCRALSSMDEAKVTYPPTVSRRRFPVHQILDAVHGDHQEPHDRQEQKSDN